MNFFLDDRINRAEVLFPGVGAFLIAAVIGSLLHASNVADIDRKLGIQRSGGIIDRCKLNLLHGLHHCLLAC